MQISANVRCELRKMLSKISVKIIPTRYSIIIIAALTNAVEYSLRSNLSIAIVEMVKKPENTSNIQPANTFDWSPTINGLILGSFYYGYLFTHLFGGQMANLWGARLLITISLIVSALLNVMTPMIANISPWALITSRFITGLLQGIMTPSVYTMFSWWIPKNEQSLALATLLVGGNIGVLSTMLASGYLCKHGFSGGWPSVFYTIGTIGFICTLLWVYYAYDKPCKHPRISKTELDYINNNLEKNEYFFKVPWTQILRSKVVWSIAIAKFASNWGYYMLITKLPDYLDSVLGLSIEQNGSYTALVFGFHCIFLMGIGYLSDKIEQLKLINRTTSRKVFEFIALIGPAILLILIPYSNHKLTIIILTTLAMIFYGFSSGGETPIVMDVAPKYCGSIYGYTQCFGSIPGFLSPIYVGFILDLDPGNVKMWNIAFFTTSGLYIFGAVIFCIFAKAERQKWDAFSEETNCKLRTKQIF